MLGPAVHSGETQLEISVTNGGGWTSAEWWHVELTTTGQLKVVVNGNERVTRVDGHAAEVLRRLVETDRILELATVYGRVHAEQSICVLSVKIGDHAREVTIGSFDHEPRDGERDEVGRAMRLFDAMKDLAGITDVPDGCEDARALLR